MAENDEKELAVFAEELGRFATLGYESEGDYRAGGYVIDWDDDAAAEAIAARDAKLLAEALRPFEELAELHDECAKDGTVRMREQNQQGRFDLGAKYAAAATEHEVNAKRIRAAIDQARKAQSGQDGGGQGG